MSYEKYSRIEHLMPVQRRKSKISNYDFLCVILYIVEKGCKWRALPKEYGNWHTIYVRLNRWSKNGTLERIFEALQNEGIISIETTIVCLDSTTVKVHPDAAGALKKREAEYRAFKRRTYDQNSFGYHVCQISLSVRALIGKRSRCAGRSWAPWQNFMRLRVLYPNG